MTIKHTVTAWQISAKAYSHYISLNKVYTSMNTRGLDLSHHMHRIEKQMKECNKGKSPAHPASVEKST